LRGEKKKEKHYNNYSKWNTGEFFDELMEGRKRKIYAYVIATYCMHAVAINSSLSFIFISSITSLEYNSFERKTKREFSHHLCW
jgi:hypothetical protein